jgi:hypothetical protein
MPNPSGMDTSFEWIELKNNSSESFNINTWTLNSKSFPDQTIQPGEFLILARDINSIINRYKITNRIIKYSFSLNNSGGQLELKKGDKANIFNYPKAKEEISFEQLVGDCNSIKENQKGNSIGKENSSCISQNNSQPINLNEKAEIIKVCPTIKNGKEYLEIKNSTNSTINLDGWKLSDLKSFEILSNISIQSKKSLIIYPSKVTLNDDGDTIKLSHPNNGFISAMTYPKLKVNECFPSITKPSSSISILPPTSEKKPSVTISTDKKAKDGVGLGLKLDLKIPKLFRILFSF